MTITKNKKKLNTLYKIKTINAMSLSNQSNFVRLLSKSSVIFQKKKTQDVAQDILRFNYYNIIHNTNTYRYT